MNVSNMEKFIAWLTSEKGIAVGEISKYLNDKSKEDIEALVNEFESIESKQIGGKINLAADKFKCGGKAKKKKPVKKCQDGGRSVVKEIMTKDRGPIIEYVSPKRDTMYTVPAPANIGGQYTIGRDKSGFWGNHQSAMTPMVKMPTEEAKKKFAELREKFKNVPVKSMEDGGRTDTLKYIRFDDGYDTSISREIDGKDTMWWYRTPGYSWSINNADNGYSGSETTVYGDYRNIVGEEAKSLRDFIEDKIKVAKMLRDSKNNKSKK